MRSSRAVVPSWGNPTKAEAKVGKKHRVTNKTHGWCRSLLLIGLLVTGYSILVFATVDRIGVSSLHGVILACIGLAALFLNCQGRKVYYSAIMFSFLYLISYPLKLATAALNGVIDTFGIHSGAFAFTLSGYDTVVAVASFAMAGIVLGQTLAKKFLSRQEESLAQEQHYNLESWNLQFNLQRWIVLWFLGSLALDMLMWYLGIGATGLQRTDPLPFRLTGIMFYTRALIMPLFALVLFELALKMEKEVLAAWMLVLIGFEGILFGLAAASKATILFRLLPLILYIWIGWGEHKYIKRFATMVLVVGMVTTLLLIPVVHEQRLLLYSTLDATFDERVQFALASIQDGFPEINLKEAAEQLITRVPGIEGIMAASGHYRHGIDLVFQTLPGSTEFHYANDVLGQGLPTTPGPLQLGTATPLFGGLFLSGSLWFVFFGAALISGAIAVIEEVFTRAGLAMGLSSIGCVVGVLLVLDMWEMSWLRIFYELPTFAVGVFIMRRMPFVKSLHSHLLSERTQ